MIDMTRRYWGHNMDIRQDQETGILRGFIWSTPGPKAGDEVKWLTSYGHAVGRVIESEWTINVDDMFRVSVEVTERVMS